MAAGDACCVGGHASQRPLPPDEPRQQVKIEAARAWRQTAREIATRLEGVNGIGVRESQSAELVGDVAPSRRMLKSCSWLNRRFMCSLLFLGAQQTGRPRKVSGRPPPPTGPKFSSGLPPGTPPCSVPTALGCRARRSLRELRHDLRDEALQRRVIVGYQREVDDHVVDSNVNESRDTLDDR